MATVPPTVAGHSAPLNVSSGQVMGAQLFTSSSHSPRPLHSRSNEPTKPAGHSLCATVPAAARSYSTPSIVSAGHAHAPVTSAHTPSAPQRRLTPSPRPLAHSTVTATRLSVSGHRKPVLSSAGQRLRTHSPDTSTQSPKKLHSRVRSPLKPSPQGSVTWLSERVAGHSMLPRPVSAGHRQ